GASRRGPVQDRPLPDRASRITHHASHVPRPTSHISTRGSIRAMPTDAVPYRKRLRAEGYDYREPGWYFVTICAQHRRCLFGTVHRSNVALSLAGEMVANELSALPSR